MLTAQNLERVIELEASLKSQYEVQLDAKSAQIEASITEKAAQQAVIEKQLEQITTMSAQASANKNVEQRNRELHSRCENLQDEIATQKTRLKGLQKDLAEERAELKTLKQFDPAKMKKNLDTNKKKLAEKAAATDLLQKSLNKSKTENAELQRKVKTLEDKLAELETPEEVEEVAA